MIETADAARRLIENGAKFVTINHGGWDTHKDHFASMRRKLPELLHPELWIGAGRGRACLEQGDGLRRCRLHLAEVQVVEPDLVRQRGVLPGHLRELARKYRLDRDGWRL